MSYKVVLEKDGSIVSCRMWGDLCVNYRLNRWVRPPHGPSLVFKQLRDAINFSYKWPGGLDVIYRCKTKRLKKVKVLIALGRFSISNVVSLFTDGPKSIPDCDCDKPPEGTYSAEEVMLTKRIGRSYDLPVPSPS